MSETRPALEELTRDELEAHVRDLEDEIESLDESTSAMRNELAFIKRTLVVLTDAEIGGEHHPLEGLPEAGKQTRGDIEDIQTAVESHGEQLSAVQDVGTEKSTKDEKIAAIAAFAAKKASSHKRKVLVAPSEVQGCTGVSRRYAYDLIDAIGKDERLDWGSVRKPESVPSGGKRTRKAKGLAVDCDRLEESSQPPDDVNKFTTDCEQEGE